MSIPFLSQKLPISVKLTLLCSTAMLLMAAVTAAVCLGSTSRTITDIVYISIVVAVLCSALLMVAIRSMLAPLERVSKMAQKVAEGDLTAETLIESTDEAGKLLVAQNSMVKSLSSMIRRVNDSSMNLQMLTDSLRDISFKVTTASKMQAQQAEETIAAAGTITVSATEVNDSVQHLSDSVSRTVHSIHEITAGIEDVAANASQLTKIEVQVHESLEGTVQSISNVKRSIIDLVETSIEAASMVFTLDASIAHIEQKVKETAAISNTVLGDAHKGRECVEATIKGMADIQVLSGTASDVIKGLSEKSRDIGKILTVINDIAEQTSLLALNAAIIAAQAGVHGKGFAVLSQEIKVLARRTSASTEEIALMIKGVQEDTRLAVDAISRAASSITEGEQLSRTSGEVLSKIVSGVQQATVEVEDIASAAAEHTASSLIIRDTMEQMSLSIGEIASTISEIGDQSEILMNSTKDIRELISHFMLSTQEQSRNAAVIANSSEDIMNLVKQMETMCTAQAHNSRKAVEAVRHIKGAAGMGMEAVGTMDTAVAGLFNQIQLLKTSIDTFKIS